LFANSVFNQVALTYITKYVFIEEIKNIKISFFYDALCLFIKN